MKSQTLKIALKRLILNFFSITGLLTVAILLLFSCHTTQKTGTPGQSVEVVEDEDSTTYELIVMDPAYDSYLLSKPSANFYSQNYYENWNLRYVLEWNHRHTNPMKYGSFYETEIHYQSFEDYGLELNYRLYYYFQFIKDKYGIILIKRGR